MSQGLKIALVRSYLRVPHAAGQVKNLIFLVKIKFLPIYANIFCDIGQVPILRNFEGCVWLYSCSYCRGFMSGLCFAIQYFMSFWICYHLDGEKRAGCFTLTVFLVTVSVLWLFLTVPWIGLQCVILVFPDQTHLPFLLPVFDGTLSSECWQRSTHWYIPCSNPRPMSELF